MATKEDSRNISQEHSDELFNNTGSQSHIQTSSNQRGAIARDHDNTQQLRNAEETASIYRQNKTDTKTAENKPQTPLKQQLKERNPQSQFLNPKARRKFGYALGGGGIVGVIVGLTFMILPLKIPAIMQTMANEAGQRIEQAAEHRGKMILARVIAQRFATSGSGVVVENGIFKSLVATMRTNKFEQKLQQKGLKITNEGDGVKLEFNGEKIAGGKVLKGEKAVYDALNGQPMTNKMVKSLVKEEIPTWRWMKRAKFAKWLRHKYGIPRYGVKNSTEADSDKAVKEMDKNRLKNEFGMKSGNDSQLLDCISGGGSGCSLLDGEDNPKGNGSKNSDDVKQTMSSANDEAIEQAVSAPDSDRSKIMSEVLTKKFVATGAVKAIPFIGFIDLVATVHHLVKEEAESDFIGKAIAGYKAANYAQLYGNWEGYSAQNQLGDLRPDFNQVLSKQTEGIERSQSHNYIAGNTASRMAIIPFGDIVYAATPDQIPGVPVDKINANKPGYIKQKLSAFNEATGGVSVAFEATNGQILEAWYNHIGQEGLLGMAADALGKVVSGLTPDVLEKWALRFMEMIWNKLLKFFELDFNPLVSGPQWHNNAHAGATVSYNLYGKENGLRKLSPTQAYEQNRSIAIERSEYLQQKGPLYALFSPDVSSSLTTQFAVRSSSDSIKNLATIGSLIASTPARMLSITTPYAHAANPYVDLYGVDPYGMTKTDLDAPLTEEFINGEDCPVTEEGEYNGCLFETEVAESMFCHLDPENEDCGDTDPDPVDAVAPSSTGGGTSFRIASYNIKSGSSDTWHTASTNNMSKNNFDIIGMQEAENWKTYNGIASKLRKLGYEIYPDIKEPRNLPRNGLQARMIAYKPDKFTRIKEKDDKVTFNRMDDPFQPAEAPVIWLQDNTTGQQIVVMNTHNPAGGPAGYKASRYHGPQQRYDAGTKYMDKIAAIQEQGFPVFFTGDFNEGYGIRLKGNVTLDGKFENLFYCRLRENGELLLNAFDVAENRKPPCSATRGPGPVDHIYVSKGVVVKAFKELRGTHDQLGTDHNIAPYADVEVPGTGAVSPTQGSFTISSYNIVNAPAHTSESEAMGKKLGCNPASDKLCIDTRSKAQADYIKGGWGNPAIDVIGLQEVSQQQYIALKKYLPDYDSSPSSIGDNQVTGSLAFFWNKSKFTKSSEGKFTNIGNVIAGPDRGKIQNPWVKLKENASQKEFYLASVHFPHAKFGNNDDAIEGIKLTKQWAQRVATKDTPVFVMGDFNEQLNGQVNGGQKKSDTSKYLYCIMTNTSPAPQFINLFDAPDGKGICPSKGSSDTGIDFIYMSDNTLMQPTKMISHTGGDASKASDHNPVYTAITTMTANGGWVWPLQSGLKPGPCYKSTSTGRVHAGVDINTDNANNPVVAMHDGTIVKTNTGGADGNSIIIKSTDGKFYWYQHLKSITKTSGSVKAGEKVAVAGKTGHVDASSAAHLHIVVYTNEGDYPSYGNLQSSIDPLSLLPQPAPGGYKCTT